ncbi:MAG: glutaredoxin family protein [Betaproteobacteria bacterium]|nr:glutaredoxin family protein [Betaproteobacteria bacterium]
MKRFASIPALGMALCILAAPLAQAELYKWVDKDGKTIYSDTPPPPDIKEVKPKKFGDNVSGPSDDLPFSMREAAKRNPVTLYANACGEPCDGARKLLAGRGIPYSERNPEKDPAAQEELKKLAGDLQVPFMLVGENQVRGFTEETFHAALTSAGYPRSFAPRSRPTDSPPPAKAAKPEETVTPVTPPAPKKK